MAVVEPPPAVSKLPLLIMGAVVALTVLVTVALVAVRGPTSYDPGTPEAALQDFLEAGLDGDVNAMVALLSEEAQAGCDDRVDDLRSDSYWYTDGLRAELEDMSIDGTGATAKVTFRQTNSSDPFDNSSWSFKERFVLVQVGEIWLIDGAGWPHQIANCARPRG